MQKKYEKMKELGYNMLDINDPFYQDICIPYESDDNTDILLSDRINYIYNNKDSQCQSNCDFSSYMSNSFYMNCSCTATEKGSTNKEEKEFSEKKIYESFYDILKYSNFKILKCYNLVFSKDIFIKNFGNIIVLINFLIYLFCCVLYFIKRIEPLKNKIIIKLLKTEENNDKNKEDNIFNNKNNKLNNLENKIVKNKNKIFNPVKKEIYKIHKLTENNSQIKKILLLNKRNKKTNYFHE